jgi:LysR family transcriptional regulator, low CO2-responsive transcriptional regulator
MDFDQLATFLEVARHTSFSRAAERRFRTQPAISAQIRSLEDEVGTRLFDRSGGKVALTDAGKLFLDYAEKAIAARKAALDRIAEVDRRPGGELTIAANEATFLHILPDALATFKQKHPRVSLQVRRAERTAIIEAVIDSTADFGIVSMPIKDDRLVVYPLHHDDIVAILPPGHALAQFKAVTLTQLARYPLLMPKPGNLRQALDRLFNDQQLRTEVSMEVDSIELLKHFVAAGLGLSFVPGSSVQEEIAHGTLCVRPIAGNSLHRDLVLIHRRDKPLSLAAQAFLELALEPNKDGSV